jgi:hypothetical protein
VTTSRTRFIEHLGKELYLIDVEGLTPDEVLALIDGAARDIRARPPGSVLTLTHVKGLQLDNRMIERLRWLADGNKPHVKAAAISGLSPVQRIVLNTMKILTRRDFHVFDTKEEAKEFLAGVP